MINQIRSQRRIEFDRSWLISVRKRIRIPALPSYNRKRIRIPALPFYNRKRIRIPALSSYNRTRIRIPACVFCNRTRMITQVLLRICTIKFEVNVESKSMGPGSSPIGRG